MKLPAALASLRPNKTWIVLGVALGIGLLAALGARSYLAVQMAEIEARGRGRLVEVVVAKFDLGKGQRLSADNLAVRSVLADQAHSLALKPDEFERVEGKTLAYGARGGEAILWAMVEGSKLPTFSARVAAGQRAMTVPVDEINSISGLLEPGDLIDLVLSLEHKGRKRSVVLMQSVAVLATGQRSVDDPKSGERRLYSTVTLDTDPQQARNIILAREAGKLTALLRNPQDRALLSGSVPDLQAWLDGQQGGAGEEVPVLYGGRGGKLPADGLRLAHALTGEPALPAPPFAAPPAGERGEGQAAVLVGGAIGGQIGGTAP